MKKNDCWLGKSKIKQAWITTSGYSLIVVSVCNILYALTIAMLLMLFSFGILSPAKGQVELAKVRALYLYNFFGLGIWKKFEDKQFPICVIGDDTVSESLSKILKKRKETRIDLSVDPESSEYSECGNAFFSKTAASEIDSGSLTESLVVSETPRTDIFLFIRDNNLVFN